MNQIKSFFTENRLAAGAIFLCFGFLLGFASAYLISAIDFSFTEKPAKSTTAETQVQKTSTSTEVTYIRKYLRSETQQEETKAVSEEMAGLTKEEFARANADWTMTSFSKDSVTLTKEVDSYPPGYYKITTAKDGDEEYVAVYQFNQDGQLSLYQMTTTPVMLLEEQTIQQLEEGIIIENKDKLNAQLENYME